MPSTRSDKTTRTLVLVAVALTLAVGVFAVMAVRVIAESASGASSDTALRDQIEEQQQERKRAKQEIEQLNQSIEGKKQQIEDLDGQIAGYSRKIQDTREKAATLQNEVELIENKIKKTELDIERTQQEIDASNLEIRSLDLQAQEKSRQIEDQKAVIGEYLRTIYRYDDRSELEILLTSDSFSKFFDQVRYLEDVEKDIGADLDRLIALKTDLDLELKKKEDKKLVLVDLQKQLDATKDQLSDAKDAKDVLVQATQENEASLRKSLQELKNEQAGIDADLANIQERLKEKLRQSDKFASLPENTTLSWPVDPSRGITAYFHDPDYPFRYVFEHPAIDIRAYQGTPVKAAASGFVARAHDGGMGYSYISIVHPGNVSTVYGHVSRILVEEDQFVERGSVIGYSGATPGTPGAGRLTTGPHLHFEVRLNGIPVNPLEYLLH